MGQSVTAERAPTDDAKDSTYFIRHCADNADTLLDPHSLLQSYGDLYVAYLGAVAEFFAKEHTVSVGVPLHQAASSLAADGGARTNQQQKTSASVSITIKLKTRAVNKVLNAIAKTGRLHTDHDIKACVNDFPLSPNQRQELFEKMQKNSSSSVGSSNNTAAESPSNNNDNTVEYDIPTTLPSVVLNMNQFVRGLGVVGTHVTHVSLGEADVEHLAFG